jgi:hypothetical protein
MPAVDNSKKSKNNIQLSSVTLNIDGIAKLQDSEHTVPSSMVRRVDAYLPAH